MVSKDFIASVITALQEPFSRMGFKAAKDNIFECSFSEEVLGMVGLNLIKSQSALEINPIVGMRNNRLDKKVMELLQEPASKLNVFAVQANVGYLSPQSIYQIFCFSDDAEPSTVAFEMVEAIEKYGVPFIKKNMSYHALLENLNRWSANYETYRIPMLLEILGMNDEATQYVHDQIAKLGARTDVISERYRSFASRFLDPAREKG